NDVTFKRCCVVPKYDQELRIWILEHFYNQANHYNYHKTFATTSEHHIGIIQEEVQAYINEYASCAVNTYLKEKTNMTPVVSIAPWKHVQIDLVDFRDFMKMNDSFTWLLTYICVFSKFLVAVHLKNKESNTVVQIT
ncbi:10738_t:CDS:1, partial [Ambispora leptoticha]